MEQEERGVGEAGWGCREIMRTGKPGSKEGSRGSLVSEIPYFIHPQEHGLRPTVFYNVLGKLILN